MKLLIAQNILKVLYLQMVQQIIHLYHCFFHILRGTVHLNPSTIFSTVMSIVFPRPWMVHIVLIVPRLLVNRLGQSIMIIIQSCDHQLSIRKEDQRVFHFQRLPVDIIIKNYQMLIVRNLWYMVIAGHTWCPVNLILEPPKFVKFHVPQAAGVALMWATIPIR